MFGSLLTVTDADLALLVAISVAVTLVLAWIYNHLLLDSLDPALASVRDVRSALIDYVFVMLLTAAIVVSLKVIGALLVEAMVVVPAAAARNLARNTRGYLVLSIATALVAGVAGLFISSQWQVPSGGAVVLALSVLFFFTLALAGLHALSVRTVNQASTGDGP
jgi:zinc transport system permease protein